MNPSSKRHSPDASAPPPPPNKKPKVHQIETTPSGIALPQKHWFDPWNSSSTGHQRAENRLSGSTSWRDSRNLKLGTQHKAARTGGERIADTVGAGSVDFGKDDRKENGSWEKRASGLRKGGQLSLFEAINRKKHKAEREEQGSHRENEDTSTVGPDAAAENLEDFSEEGQEGPPNISPDDLDAIPPSYQPDSNTRISSDGDSRPLKQIFVNLVFYINGSTAPLISDHKLKSTLALHGGSLSISHTRKTVTHVIIGNPHNYISKGGAGSKGTGGALAGTKIQKEIMRTRGKGVKFVSAEWVLESIKAGKRLSEARFENVKVGGAGQGSVFNQFRTTKPGITSGVKSESGSFDDGL